MAREFLISGLRQLAAQKHIILAAERVGKHKTISQMVAVLVSLAYLSLGEFGMENSRSRRFLAASQIYIYWIALLLTVLSGVFYFWKNAAIVQQSMDDELPVAHRPAGDTRHTREPAKEPGYARVQGMGSHRRRARPRRANRHPAQGRHRGGPRRFQAEASEILALPYRLSPAMGKDQARAAPVRSPPAEPEKEIALDYFAEVTDAVYLSSWAQVARLDDAHFWGEEILRERFDYKDRPGMEAGLHLLIVRVSRINLPHKLAPSKDYEGCKSWIEVPVDWEHDIATHCRPHGGIRHAPQPDPRRRGRRFSSNRRLADR